MRVPQNLKFVGLMQYDGDLLIPARFLVAPPEIDSTVAEHLSAAGRTALAVSETQKFGHVTYFFNGNRSSALPGETWQEVESHPGPADDHPEMKADAIVDAVISALEAGGFDHLRCNLAVHFRPWPLAVLRMRARIAQLERRLGL